MFFNNKLPRTPDMLIINTTNPNPADDNIPQESILKDVKVRKISDNVFQYQRTYKVSYTIVICGVCYLEGQSWINKILNMLTSAAVPSAIMTKMSLDTSNNTVTLTLGNFFFKNLASIRLGYFLRTNYNNIVFIKN